MLEQIKNLPSKAAQLFGGGDNNDARDALKRLESELKNEWRDGLSFVSGAPFPDLGENESVHTSIENLTECHTAIRVLAGSDTAVSPEHAATVIGTHLADSKRLLKTEFGGNERAINIGTKTMNLLFAAGQEIRSEFGVRIRPSEARTPPTPELGHTETAATPVLELPSAMLFQLRQSLFPAERMIVGAGRRGDRAVRIDALFDVTGVASAGGVKADPARMSQALRAMSVSGTYLALWVHSHPGHGPDATHPSMIDIRQHAIWLKNFSEDLVSAIMVADKYVRFWGTGLDLGKISISISGDGVVPASSAEHVYKMEE